MPPSQRRPQRPGLASEPTPVTAHAPLGFSHLVDVLQRGSAANTEAPVRPAPPRKPAVVKPVVAAQPAPAPVALAALLDQAEQCARSARLQDAVDLCHRIAPLVIEENDARHLARREYVLLLAHQFAGRFREAAVAGYKALEWFQRCGDDSGLARTLTLQASVIARISDAGGALELLQRAAALLDTSAACTPRDRAIFWNNSGDMHFALGRHEAAAADSERAIEAAAQAGEAALGRVARGNLLAARMRLCEQRGVPAAALDTALAELRVYIADMGEAGAHHLVPRAARYSAEALIAGGRLDEAHDMLRVGVQAAERVGAGPDKAMLCVLQARLCRLRGVPRLAASHAADAIALLSGTERRQDLANAHLEHCLLLESQGRWRAALDSHRRYAELMLEAHRVQADARLEAAALRLDLERRPADGTGDAAQRIKS